MRTMKMTLEYLGTHYSGWQRQLRAPSIQEGLERALSTLLREEIAVYGSGRTDAGVHAFNQVATFKTASELDLGRMRWSLNAILPGDIVVKALEEVADDFDARRDAAWREYRYYILNRPYASVFFSGVVHHVAKALDVSAMDDGIKHLIGRHDFAAFCLISEVEGSTVRTVLEASVVRNGDIVWAGEPLEGLVTVRLRAHAFLYNMMRVVTGTLLDVGRGKLSPDDVKTILESKDRSKAGQTAPPHGLTLVEVAY
ncbi:MAG: tRNA pseudouridine(38-40) synthase TruA [Actinobacteria bacterium]|nr:tRNA pseudouridine(38-40) synthase TruA [Chloroflexota bacterium]MCL5291911.1 tRNA pseudouridine(38-40) synthase TruA [Actinomycetota bacterium]